MFAKEFFVLKESKIADKGLFAKKFIPKGTITCFECVKCKRMTTKEFQNLPEAKRRFASNHEYITEDGLISDVCDKTVLFLNHSCNANILDTGKFDIVVRDMKAGEQATYDYRTFYEKFNMKCKCDEYNCCGTVRPVHPVPAKLKAFWNRKIKSALKRIHGVPQPLKKELIRSRKWPI